MGQLASTRPWKNHGGKSNTTTLEFPTLLSTFKTRPSAQKDDLQSQVKAMEQFCLAQGVAVTNSIQEIGGGLNFKRPKFLQIVQ